MSTTNDKGWNGTRVEVGKRVGFHNTEYRLPTGARGVVEGIYGDMVQVRLTRLPKQAGLDCPWSVGQRISVWVWWVEGESRVTDRQGVVLTDREHAAVVAGLRLLDRVRDEIPPEWDIATNGGALECLSTDEVNALCSRLNR